MAGGDGTLGYSAVSLNLTLGYQFAAGDVNGDGLTDFVLADNTSGSCPAGSTQYGTTSGGFTSGAGYCLSATSTVVSAQLPDFDADGLADGIVTVNIYGSLISASVRNTGSAFANYPVVSGTPLVINGQPYVGDGNGDGAQDVFTATAYFQSTGSGFAASSSGPLADFAAADFDGDGCVDAVNQTSAQNITFSCSSAVASMTIPSWVSNGYQVVVGDFNGDNKADFLTAKSSATGTEQLSTGTGLVASGFSVPTSWAAYKIVTGDWNGDGKTDVALISQVSGTPHLVFLSTGTGFTQVASISNSINAPKVVVADWNSDGADDLWMQSSSGDTEYLFSFTPELMTSVSNGIGATTSITYDRLNKNGTFYTKVTAPVYPMLGIDGPYYVVSRTDQSNGIGGTYAITYSYGGGMVDLARQTPYLPSWNLLGSTGFFGFSKLVTTDPQTNIVTTTNYHTDFPYVGLLASQTVTHGSVTLRTATNSYGTQQVGGMLVTHSQTYVTSHDLDGTALPDATTSYTYDSYGNPLTIVNWVSGGPTETITNTFTNNTTNWILGLLTNETDSRTVPGNSPPVAVNDMASTTSGTAVTFDPRVNDADPDGDGLTIISTSTPLHGTVTINSGTSLTYAPASGYTGSDNFTYTLSDGAGFIAMAPVTVTVTSSSGGGFGGGGGTMCGNYYC